MTLADLCAALFSREPDEMDVAARCRTTVEEVHAFYNRLAELGLVVLEDRILGTWTRTTKGAPTLDAFLVQVTAAGSDLTLTLSDSPVEGGVH